MASPYHPAPKVPVSCLVQSPLSLALHSRFPTIILNMPTYAAKSYHINVQQGDAAIHDLYEDGQIISRILIDAGKGNANSISNLRNFIKSSSRQFDAVVITHWDSDHYMGLYNLFLEEVNHPGLLGSAPAYDSSPVYSGRPRHGDRRFSNSPAMDGH
jgi:glyoxylase-like metal-dependent hydrolase (beta-lactamase superfamily II)